MHHMAMLQMNQLAESAAAAAALSSSSSLRYSQPQRLEPFHNQPASAGLPTAPSVGSVSSQDVVRVDSARGAQHHPSVAALAVAGGGGGTAPAATAGGAVALSPGSAPRAGFLSRLGIGAGSSRAQQQDVAMRSTGDNRV